MLSLCARCFPHNIGNSHDNITASDSSPLPVLKLERKLWPMEKWTVLPQVTQLVRSQVQVSGLTPLICYSEETEQGRQGLSGRLHWGYSLHSCRSSTLPSWPGASNTSGRAQEAASWGGWIGQWQSHWTWQPGREEWRHQLSCTPTTVPKEAR